MRELPEKLQAVIFDLDGTLVDTADEFVVVVQALRASGLRVDSDLRNESISYKVRQHSVEKIPVLLVVGNREAEQGTVAVRRLGSKRQSVGDLQEVIAALGEEVASRAAPGGAQSQAAE